MKFTTVLSIATCHFIATSIYAQTPTSISVDNPSDAGGRVSICNSSKTGAITSNWSIWNMTGGYGNGLSFWRYNADGTNAGPSVWFSDNGNVGLGTMSPTQHLEINGGGIGFSGPGLNPVDKKLYSPTDGVLEWVTHNAAGQHGFAVSHQGEQRVFLNSQGNSYFIGGNLGVGTTSPSYRLTASASDSHLQLRRESSEASGGKVVFIELYQNDPAASLPEVYPCIRFHHNNRFWDRIEGRPDGFHFKQGHLPSDDYVGISAGNGFFAGNVGIGTTSPTEKLSVNGKIRAKEVIVDTGWSDYVFAKDYKLASLSEVEQHIEQQGHLPGVPSAQEVAEKGVSVGDMQAILLAKIEELTLHQIAQEKELAAQHNQLAAATAKIDAQQAEIVRLTTQTK